MDGTIFRTTWECGHCGNDDFKNEPTEIHCECCDTRGCVSCVRITTCPECSAPICSECYGFYGGMCESCAIKESK